MIYCRYNDVMRLIQMSWIRQTSLIALGKDVESADSAVVSCHTGGNVEIVELLVQPLLTVILEPGFEMYHRGLLQKLFRGAPVEGAQRHVVQH
jgi:hypothetical protein